MTSLVILPLYEDQPAPNENCSQESLWKKHVLIKALIGPDTWESLACSEGRDTLTRRNIKVLDDRITYESKDIVWIARIETLKEIQDLVADLGADVVTFYKSDLNPGYEVAEW